MGILHRIHLGKIVFRGTLVLGVVLVILIFLGIWHHIHLAALVQQELEAVRARGEPLTPTELSDFYRTPDFSPEVTAEWLQTLDPIQSIEDEFNFDYSDLGPTQNSDYEVDDLTWKPTDEMILLLQRSTDKADSPLSRASELAEQHQQIRYPLTFDDIFASGLPASLDSVRSLQRSLARRYYLDLRNGNSDRLYESFQLLHNTSQTFEPIPDSMFQLCRWSLLNTISHGFRQSMARMTYSDSQLAYFQHALLQFNSAESIRMTLLGERVTGQLLFEEIAKQSPRTSMNFVNSRYADKAAFLQWWRRLIEANERPPIEQLDLNVEAELAKAIRGNSYLLRQRFAVTQTILPSYQVMTNAVHRTAMSAEATSTMIACQRFQQRVGRYPESLKELPDDLSNGLPHDPYSPDQLYQYKKLPDRILVYSIGTNQVDDGGTGDYWQVWGSLDLVLTMFLNRSDEATNSQ